MPHAMLSKYGSNLKRSNMIEQAASTHQLSDPISNAGEKPVLKSALKGTVTFARFTKILAYISNSMLTTSIELQLLHFHLP